MAKPDPELPTKPVPFELAQASVSPSMVWPSPSMVLFELLNTY